MKSGNKYLNFLVLSCVNSMFVLFFLALLLFLGSKEEGMHTIFYDALYLEVKVPASGVGVSLQLGTYTNIIPVFAALVLLFFLLLCIGNYFLGRMKRKER